MPSSFPTAIDALSNPLSSDPRVGHAGLHGTINDAVEAIEAKIGTGSSDATSASNGDVLTADGSGGSAWAAATGGSSTVKSAAITFTQTAGDGTYTGSVTLPAGAELVDWFVEGSALWDGGTATLDIGDGGSSIGFLSGFDLAAVYPPLSMGEAPTVVYAVVGWSGAVGSYLDPAAFYWTVRTYPAGGTITATVTQTGAGTAGRTTVTVVWAEPTTSAATKA